MAARKVAAKKTKKPSKETPTEKDTPEEEDPGDGSKESPYVVSICNMVRQHPEKAEELTDSPKKNKC